MDYTNLPPLTKGALSLESWNEDRRQEVLELFRREVYGRIPDEESISVSFNTAEQSSGYMEGRANRAIVEIICRRLDKEFVFPLYLFTPAAKTEPVPCILTIMNRALSDADPSRRSISQFWPAEMIIARGYAAAVLITHEIAPDYEESFTTRFHRLFPEYVKDRPSDSWGAISAWAWAMSRAIDYLSIDKAIKADSIAVAGHSRGGKTALWCAAQDPRAALVLSSCSGCSGGAITRGKTGEHIKEITGTFPYWFSANYRKYADKEDSMPFDQHMMAALIAPRPLYLSHKTQDAWCDPRAEYETLKQIAPLYGLYGKPSPLGDAMPGPEETVVSGNLGFHLKSGTHDMDEYDWERFLAFGEAHFSPC
ncbi:MAG: alpha/beta hydrolase [Treponema sp.]|nr:alpha/beta hydrolase [Treponema sp.]